MGNRHPYEAAQRLLDEEEQDYIPRPFKRSIDDATPAEWDAVAKKIREQKEDFLDITDQLEMYKDNGEYGS